MFVFQKTETKSFICFSTFEILKEEFKKLSSNPFNGMEILLNSKDFKQKKNFSKIKKNMIKHSEFTHIDY